MIRFFILRLVVLIGLVAQTAHASVIINEIMYHPSSENPAEEWIELYNDAATPVSLTGWKLTSGVSFTFGSSFIPANGYLVVAANSAAFSAKYPGVTNFVAGWAGKLSNRGNKITLTDNLGVDHDEVKYADDGDWADRYQDNPPDLGHRGWNWNSDADGLGKSLELIQPAFDNSLGQNWKASITLQGTPGVVNSSLSANVAPFISDVQHYPLIPKSTDTVTITAKIQEDVGGAVTATLFFREDGVVSWSSTTMLDGGIAPDALAGDKIYTASIAAKANLKIVEFYVRATDNGGRERFWPKPAFDFTLTPTQACNALYQVDDSTYTGAAPIYRVIMKAADRAELTAINDTANTADSLSDARYNTTFITIDGVSNELRYLCATKNRGHGSSTSQPPNFNISIPGDWDWKGKTSFDFNTQHTYLQLLGSAIFRKAGVVAPESRQIQLRVNAVDPTTVIGGSNQGASNNYGNSFGFYVCNEAKDSEFAEHHYPQDDGGNVYAVRRMDNPPNTEGNLAYMPPTGGQTPADPYRAVYFKQTNKSEDDWTDLIATTSAISKGQSASLTSMTWDADYVSSIEATINVDQWMRWIAVESLISNVESNLMTGIGDDYYLYFGALDRRAQLVPHDLDTILGDGVVFGWPSYYLESTQISLFRLGERGYVAGEPTPINSFIKHPQFVTVYYRELLDLINNSLSVENFSVMSDQLLAGLVVPSIITDRKNWYNLRVQNVRSQIPLEIKDVTAVGLTTTNGYPRTTSASCQLTGRAHAVDTRSVKVNGNVATWTAWSATWTSGSVALTPGINRILIQAFDGANNEIDRSTFDVWYDDSTVTNVSGSIATTTWTAAAGPYNVTSNITVPNGATLTIQPGTTVYFAAGTNLTVQAGGRLLAVGTETQPIRFTSAPATAPLWGGIIINGTTPLPAASQISYAFFERNGNATSGTVALVAQNNANVIFDHLEFGATGAPYMHLDGVSFLVSDCIFPTATAAFEPMHGTLGIPAGGRGIIRNCFFGKAMLYNDVIDFSGGNRPSAVVQYINNVFAGSDDDILDLDASDSWIEGNIFMNCHRVNSPDSASAVSGGAEGGITSEITMVGNIFYNNDHAVTAKHGNFYTMLNNTIVKQSRVGGQEPVAAVLNLGESDAGVLKGLGLYLEGNIISDAEALVVNYDSGISTLTLNNNLLPFTWAGPGSGNTVNDPFFNDITNVPTPTERNFRYLVPKIREMFSLKSNSPAKGTGPNGQDRGAIRSLGVSISGAPVGTTNQTSATLTVGKLMTGNGIPSSSGKFPSGSGWTHYKYRLDGGSWSPEIAISNQINLAGLTNGTHYVEVVGKNDADFYQDHADYGSSASITTTASWTVNTGYTPPAAQAVVQINEVLANNLETLAFSGVYPDIIELRNAGTVGVDLSGWGLTDNSSLPYKYTIPNGTTLAAGAHLVIYASNNGSVPQPKTGFGIKTQGDTITLTKSLAAGGGVADSIAYGNQVPDYSIGRAADGSWGLCAPTFGSTNQIQATGNLYGVLINEWLADPGILASDDFVELYNPSNNPVNIGNCYLTDNTGGWPDRHQIRQLTFIPAAGYMVFQADENTNSGPDHLNFKLSALQGEIGLFDTSLNEISTIVYGPQRTDFSEGRSPNGSNTMATFNQPTAGSPNPSPTGTQTVNLIPSAHVWKYYASTAAPPNDAQGRVFSATAYDDSLWNSGPSLLYVEPDTLNPNTEGFIKTTPLPQRAGGGPLQTSYFRTHFNYSGPINGTTLIAKIMVDDGCVVYLNGVEIIPTTGNRIRVAGGTVTYNTTSTTSATDGLVETYSFTSNQLVVGDNVIAISVHQNGTSSSDVNFGLKLDASISSPVIINEVFVLNNNHPNPDLTYSGWVELYNPSANAVNLTDYSLSDNISESRKYVFGNVSIPAFGFLVVQCNPLMAVSSTNTGFGLNGTGDQVYLFGPLSTNGTLLNSISFGNQLPDYSIGRYPNGGATWTLTSVSRGSINNAAAGVAAASTTNVKINEWSSFPTAEDSWFEIYNTSASPVILSGNYFTDNLADKKKYLIPALTYIGGSGSAKWQKWIADNDNGGKFGHVNFALNPAGESIGLFSSTNVQLNAITYAAQSPNQSGGRFADGSATIVVSLSPTPGAMNVQLATDTDLDGIPDAWETANGFNPNSNADAALDTDGDGQTNLQEYLAGTNPRLPGSRLAATVTSAAGGGQFAINFTALAGKTYTVRYKNALSDASWQVLEQIGAPSADTPTVVYDSPAMGTGKRFYQVVTPGIP